MKRFIFTLLLLAATTASAKSDVAPNKIKNLRDVVSENQTTVLKMFAALQTRQADSTELAFGSIECSTDDFEETVLNGSCDIDVISRFEVSAKSVKKFITEKVRRSNTVVIEMSPIPATQIAVRRKLQQVETRRITIDASRLDENSPFQFEVSFVEGD